MIITNTGLVLVLFVWDGQSIGPRVKLSDGTLTIFLVSILCYGRLYCTYSLITINQITGIFHVSITHFPSCKQVYSSATYIGNSHVYHLSNSTLYSDIKNLVCFFCLLVDFRLFEPPGLFSKGYCI